MNAVRYSCPGVCIVSPRLLQLISESASVPSNDVCECEVL